MVIPRVDGKDAVFDISKKNEIGEKLKKEVHIYCHSINQLRWFLWKGVSKNQGGLELCYDGYGGFRQINRLPAHSIIPVDTFLKRAQKITAFK